MPLCFRCKSPVETTTDPAIFVHPKTDACSVAVTDKAGVSLDDIYEVQEGEVFAKDVPKKKHDELNIEIPALAEARAETVERVFLFEFPNYRNHEEAINELFSEANAPRLGGASGDLGWSSFYTFQRCPYLWYRNYLVGERSRGEVSPALVIGSLLHLFLALHYQLMIDPTYPLTVDQAFKELKAKRVNAEALEMAWNIFEGYRTWYSEYDYLRPLAVEFHTVDPKTKESCRYDMIAEVDASRVPPGKLVPEGVYIIEHKTSGRFDKSTLEGWTNDGEIIGQVMLYKRMRLEERFGPLRGVIVNICGKQKTPKYARVIVSPSKLQLENHARDLKFWEAFRQLCKAQDNFPRSRANCINRWGMCPQWEHCQLNARDATLEGESLNPDEKSEESLTDPFLITT
jgi:hypothetical protein